MSAPTQQLPVHKLFAPVTLFNPEVDAMLAAAEDIEVVYALPPEDRRFGVDAKRAEQLRLRIDRELELALPDLAAICAVTIDGQLGLPAATLERAPELRVVFIIGVGTDSVDVAAATRLGIAVVNTPGSNYVSVAEQTVGMILACSRRIALGDRIAHADRRPAAVAELGGFPAILRGKTITLIGLGFIGREVARICREGFGMRICAVDPVFNPVEAERLGIDLTDDLGAAVAEADVVSVHAPLTEATRHLIDARVLAQMKDTALLVNTSRGGTVDTEALVQALEAGSIGGAALDVTDPEPLPAEHPLYRLDNVVLTPHSAGGAPEQVPRAALLAARSAVQVLRGERPWNLVDPDVWPAYVARLEGR